ncbi:MAG: hypothetical protein QF724_11550 [Planctomycetota bacterium]|jgi:hypothetical protein|nr:hypothetical protein [Planctomycetota bacterium]MDP6839564.1 hypothetical protein [Planctomycetota bacterium]
MKHLPTLALAAIALPLASAFRAPADTLVFAPAKGLTLTKTFTSEGDFGLDNMSMLMNGQESPMMPDMEMSFNTAQTIVVVDEYGKVDDGQPLKLTRTFDELSTNIEVSSSMDMGGESQAEDQSIESSSELEGLTVEFTWDAEEEEYTKEFPDGDGDDDLLEGLFEDMDLRVLLPDDEVSKGDEWEIDPSDLKSILAPGGDLALEPEEMEDGGMSMGPSPGGMDFSEMFGDLLEGEATATFEGTREVDGLEVGVITLVVEIDSANDMTDMLEDMVGSEELPEGMEMSFDRMDVEIELEAEGTLYWDVSGGHVHSFDLSGELALMIDMAMTMDIPGQGEMTVENTMEMSGTMSQELAVE